MSETAGESPDGKIFLVHPLGNGTSLSSHAISPLNHHCVPSVQDTAALPWSGKLREHPES